jgi:hypothetical protein
MKLRFDQERAVKLFTILQDLWVCKAGVFEGVVLPQDRWPMPDDPVAAANYLCYAAITQRGGVVSEDPFKWVNHLRQSEPSLFIPHIVAEQWTVPRIMEVIKQAVTDRKSWRPEPTQLPTQLSFFKKTKKRVSRPAKPKNEKLYKLDEFAASWHHNSVTIATRWHGNPLNIFEGVTEFEAAFARVDYKNKTNKGLATLSGIRRKIFSLFTIWLQEKGLVPIFPTPVPVDFHALRLLFATHVVQPEVLPVFVGKPNKHPADFEGRPMLRVTERLTDAIALWSQPFMVEYGFSHMAINPALWVLSRELCPSEFQNKSRGRGRQGSRGDIKLNYPELLRADIGRWPMPYTDPATVCPVAPLCKLAIPNSPYGAFGILALLERLPYPHPSFEQVVRTLSPRKRKNDRK